MQGVDGRSASARRFRDLYQGFCRDLGDDPSEADKALARSAAALAVNGELLQAKLAAGEAVDPDELVRNANGLARVMAALKTKTKPGVGAIARRGSRAAPLQRAWRARRRPS